MRLVATWGLGGYRGVRWVLYGFGESGTKTQVNKGFGAKIAVCILAVFRRYYVGVVDGVWQG